MVFGLDTHKNPLMPGTETRARQLLECGRAVVHTIAPLTIDHSAEGSHGGRLECPADPGPVGPRLCAL